MGKNRRNVRDMGRFSGDNVKQNTDNRTPATGQGTLDPGNALTRRQFIGTAAAGLGAAALGAGGVVKAIPQMGELNPVDGYYEVYPYPYQNEKSYWDLINVQLAVMGMELLLDSECPTPIPGFPSNICRIPGFTGKVRLKSVAYGTDIQIPFSFDGINPILEFFGILDCRAVMLVPSATVVGDGVDMNGNPKTVIHGGGGVASVPMPPYVEPVTAIKGLYLPELEPLFGQGGHYKIDGIWFRGQDLGAVGGFNWKSLEITNNKMTDIQSYTFEPGMLGPEQTMYFETRLPVAILKYPIFEEFNACKFDPSCNILDYTPKTPEGDPMTPGTILLQGNIIDNTDLFTGPIGIPEGAEYGAADTGINVIVTNDETIISNNQLNSLGISLYTSVGLGPSTSIEANTILSYLHSPFDAAIWCFDQYSAKIHNNDIKLQVDNNSYPPSPPQGAALSLSNRSGTFIEVDQNRISMGSIPEVPVAGLAAIHMGDPSFCFFATPLPLQGASIHSNQINGKGRHAIVAFDYPPISPWFTEPFLNMTNSNSVYGNDMATFIPIGGWYTWLFQQDGTPVLTNPVHVYLGPYTYDNEFRGYFGGKDSITDLNPDCPYYPMYHPLYNPSLCHKDRPNFVTGYVPMKGAGGVGVAVSTAMLEEAGRKRNGLGMVLNAMGAGAKIVAEKLKQQ